MNEQSEASLLELLIAAKKYVFNREHLENEKAGYTNNRLIGYTTFYQ